MWLLITAYTEMQEQINDLKLEIIFKQKVEHKTLKYLQPGHVADKKKALSNRLLSNHLLEIVA